MCSALRSAYAAVDSRDKESVLTVIHSDVVRPKGALSPIPSIVVRQRGYIHNPPQSASIRHLGIQGTRASTTLITNETATKESHKHHNPVTLQPSLIVSGSLMDRP